MPTTTQARAWLDRWDRQQERYVADREERFEVIADVVGSVVTDRQPVVLDLGCGPGSLSVRLAGRLPGARIVGVDADDLLLGLAQLAYGEVANVRFVHADLRNPDWVDEAGVARGVDAAVSTTALHWLDRTELATLYRVLATVVRSGGIVVDGDHLHTGSTVLDGLEVSIPDARAGRALRSDTGEDWAGWWSAVGDAPELRGLLDTRGARPIEHEVDDLPTVEDHLRLLRESGFSTAGSVWQHGDDRVLVGIRD